MGGMTSDTALDGAGGNADSSPSGGVDYANDIDFGSGPSSPASSSRPASGSAMPKNNGLLTAPVGPNATNWPEDVSRVESVLSERGLLDRPPGETYQRDTYQAIREGQVDLGTTPDGLINPNGPTRNAFLKRSAPAPGQPRKPSVSTPVKAPLSLLKPTPAPAPTLSRRVDPVLAKAVPVKTAPTKVAPMQPLAIPVERAAENVHTADALKKTRDNGMVPQLYADSIKSDGANGVALTRDLIGKVAKDDPARAKKLTIEIAGQLGPEDRAALLGGAGKGRLGDGVRQQKDQLVQQPQSPAKPSGHTVADYRKEAVSQESLDRFMSHHPNASKNLQKAYAEIHVAEGGPKKDGSGSSAYGGITNGALEIAKKHEPSLNDVKRPEDLAPAQLAAAYRGYTKDVMRRYGGIEKLNTLKDPKTAAIVADALFMHGANGGATDIKNGVRDLMNKTPPGLQTKLNLKPLPKGSPATDTFHNLAALDRAGMGKALRGAITERRLERGRRELSKGEKARINHFRF